MKRVETNQKGKPKRAYKKFQTPRERRMEHQKVSLSEQLKGRERKMKQLLRHEENYLDKVLAEVDARGEQRRPMRQAAAAEQPKEPEQKLITRAERQRMREERQAAKEEKVKTRRDLLKKKAVKSKKGQPVQKRLVEYYLAKLGSSDAGKEAK